MSSVYFYTQLNSYGRYFFPIRVCVIMYRRGVITTIKYCTFRVHEVASKLDERIFPLSSQALGSSQKPLCPPRWGHPLANKQLKLESTSRAIYFGFL